MRFTQQSAFLVAVLAGSTFAAPMPRGVGGAFKGIEKVGDVADAANNAASQNPDVVQDAEAKAKGFFHKIHLRDLDTREPRRSKFETVEKVGSAVNTGGNFASGIENMYDEVHQQRDLDTRAPKGKSVEKIQKAAGVANAAHNVDGAEPDAAPMNEDPFSADFLTKRDIIADVKAEVSKLTQRGLESEARDLDSREPKGEEHHSESEPKHKTSVGHHIAAGVDTANGVVNTASGIQGVYDDAKGLFQGGSTPST